MKRLINCRKEDYRRELEIVNELLKSKSHIREIAKKLGTNHMNVLRKIKKAFKRECFGL